MKGYLLRQGSIKKAQVNRYFMKMLGTDRAETSMNHINERYSQHRVSVASGGTTASNIRISVLRIKLLLIVLCRHFLLAVFSLIISTRTWLFIAVFLICAFEAPRVTPNNPTITVIRITFEVISAFGGCGLSMGFSSTSPSLAAVLTSSSKIVLILVMCMGRHRGLLDSMKDQEEIEYSAQILIDSWRRFIVYNKQLRKKSNFANEVPTVSIKVTTPTSPLSTRL